jgi:thiol-disulfide isomerase/thioredoxin
MNKQLITLLLTAGLFSPVGVTAQTNDNATDTEPKITLRVGDAAPPLAPGKWIKGEPVKSFEKDKVYVVEFWATWCPPCRTTIPHLTELQAKHKDVIIIGQSVSERNPDTVAAFVEKMGTNMNYRVAVDDVSKGKSGLMNLTWMEAAGQDGLPTAFLVGKDGKIAWIGHPTQLEPILELVLAGQFDPVKQAAIAAKQLKLEQELKVALTAKDFDTALKLTDELGTIAPHFSREATGLKFQILLEKKDYDAAYKLGPRLLELLKDDVTALNAVAWMLVTDEQLEKRDLALAEKMALRANELTKSENSNVLDTTAKVYATQGDYVKAVEWGTKAVAKANEEEKAEIEKTLATYKAKLNK